MNSDTFVPLTDPIFWISSILVGFLINLLSAYFSDAFKRVWGRYSENQRIKNRLEKVRIDEDARRCTAVPFYFSLGVASTGINPFAEQTLASVSIIVAFLGLFAAEPLQKFSTTRIPWLTWLTAPLFSNDAISVITLLCVVPAIVAMVAIGRSVRRSGYWGKVAKRAKEMLDEQYSSGIQQAK
jgi:hypothetical protein